jgi:hypothetical protein
MSIHNTAGNSSSDLTPLPPLQQLGYTASKFPIYFKIHPQRESWARSYKLVVTPIGYLCDKKYCVSVTLWSVSGSSSLTNGPVLTPDPTPFFSDFKDAKKLFFHIVKGRIWNRTRTYD